MIDVDNNAAKLLIISSIICTKLHLFDFATKIGVTYFRFPSPAHQKENHEMVLFFRTGEFPPIYVTPSLKPAQRKIPVDLHFVQLAVVFASCGACMPSQTSVPESRYLSLSVYSGHLRLPLYTDNIILQHSINDPCVQCSQLSTSVHKIEVV